MRRYVLRNWLLLAALAAGLWMAIIGAILWITG